MDQAWNDQRHDETTYPRGGQTRAQIVRGALPVFAALGYDGASVRALAEPSGSRHAAIQYYFGGKEGLFRACAESLCETTLATLVTSAQPLMNIPLESGRGALIEGMLAFCTDVIRSTPRSGDEDLLLFLSREQSSPCSPAFTIICEDLYRPLVAMLARIVGAIIGRPERDEETLLRTSSIIASMLGMRAQVPITLNILGWKDVSTPRQNLWNEVFRTHLRSVLTGRLETANSI